MSKQQPGYFPRSLLDQNHHFLVRMSLHVKFLEDMTFQQAEVMSKLKFYP